MISDRPPVPAVRSLRGLGPALPLLVVALLYGLLAMHGLGPTAPVDAGGRSAASHSAGPNGPVHAASPADRTATGRVRDAGAAGPATPAHPVRTDAEAAYGHPAGARTSEAHGPRVRPEQQHADECECGGTNGHAAHADATCAASGISGAPSMDGPAAASGPAGPLPATGLRHLGPRTGGERAPPSLHSLQLLRI